MTKKGTDQTKSQLSSPNNLLVSFLSTELRENTGIQPTGKLVYFYETYLTNTDHYKNIVSNVVYKSGKGISNVAAVSIESLFTPYSTNFDSSGDFPSFETPSSRTIDATSLFLNPFNPFNLFGSGTPGSGFGKQWMDSGHNIVMAAVGSGIGVPTGIPSGSGIDCGCCFDCSGYIPPETNPESFVFDQDFEIRGKAETSNVRSLGLRSPLVLSGWGFDVDGSPVPSSGGGIHPDAFWNPKLWKTGPVDLRWDDDRKVWTGGNQVKIYLVKMTNEYVPSCFSYEVDRATTRAQYTRVTMSPRQYSSDTGTLPTGIYRFPETGIYDPEYVAYNANVGNSGCFERLNFTSVEYPYYEAFIIRETNLDPSPSLIYNIWTEDCHDCGHITNQCSAGTNHGSPAEGKKILIENPLREGFNAGDLAFTVKTGRKKQVYSGGFSGGNGAGASGQFSTDGLGNLSFTVTNGGSGYINGAFGVYDQPCAGLTLFQSGGVITSGTIIGTTTGYLANQTYPIQIVSNDSSATTEELDIHWVLRSESKTVQIVNHVEANGGVLQTCTQKIQVQGFSTCSHCGENSSLVNNFI